MCMHILYLLSLNVHRCAISRPVCCSVCTSVGQKCVSVKVSLSLSSLKSQLHSDSFCVLQCKLTVWIVCESWNVHILNDCKGICLNLFSLSSSPSWDTWQCSSVPCTPTCMAGAGSSLPLPTNGTLLRPTCSVWWCPLWWSCSSCWSSCPVWTTASPAFDGAGRGPIQRTTARNHC